jgi:RHS repeat-associated protein
VASSADGTVDYAYDATNQLTGADHSSQTDEAYQYDANGNRTNVGYQTGINNQLLADGQFTYQYDQEGNRTKRTETATGKVTEYVWDYHNRLAQVLFKDGSGAVTKSIEYTYDVNNQRIGKKIDTSASLSTGGVVTERYVIDRNQIALVFDGSGVQKSRYLYGTQIDQVLAEESGNQVHWFLADNQGTVKDVVDNTGAVIDHITYDSFGRIVSQTSPVDLRFAYTGREWDGETSQYYYRARYYDAAVGKFIGEDPIGFSAEDTNLSRYVGNSATNFIDPSGYAPVLDRPPVITPISPVVNGGAQSFGSKVLGLGSKILRVGGPAIGLLTDLVFPQPLSDGTLRRNRKPTPLPQPSPSPSTPARPYGPPERPIPIERMTDREIERMLDKRLRDIQNQGPKLKNPPQIHITTQTDLTTPIDDPNDCEKKTCNFSIDEQHLFHPDTRRRKLEGFHSTARTIESIDYNWESPPNFEADFEPFGAYFTIPGQTQFEPKFSTFFPINATDFAVIEAIGEAYIKSGCIPTGVWSASVHNPVTGEAMGIQGTVQNHVILTAFPSI